MRVGALAVAALSCAVTLLAGCEGVLKVTLGLAGALADTAHGGTYVQPGSEVLPDSEKAILYVPRGRVLAVNGQRTSGAPNRLEVRPGLHYLRVQGPTSVNFEARPGEVYVLKITAKRVSVEIAGKDEYQEPHSGETRQGGWGTLHHVGKIGPEDHFPTGDLLIATQTIYNVAFDKRGAWLIVNFATPTKERELSQAAHITVWCPEDPDSSGSIYRVANYAARDATGMQISSKSLEPPIFIDSPSAILRSAARLICGPTFAPRRSAPHQQPAGLTS